MPMFCGVVGCTNNSARVQGKSFFRIPSITNSGGNVIYERILRRNAWIQILQRQDLTERQLKHIRICSDHFVSGRPADPEDYNSPDYMPSVNMDFNGLVKKTLEEGGKRKIFAMFQKRATNRWTVGQVEALIDQYKKYPVLYDTNHEEFANKEVKSACLTSIVEALQSVRLGVTEVDVTSQWNNLTIKYAQATQVQNSETAVGKEPQFWYLDKLEFLQNQTRPTEVKLEDFNVDFEEANLFEPEITTKTHEARGGTDPLTTSFEIKEEIEDSPPTKRMRENEDSESGDMSHEDESEIFGKFVAFQLRKITDEEIKQDTIFEIHKVLYKALKKK